MTTLEKCNLSQLCEQSNIPETLIRAVVRQIGGWASFTESAPDVCRGGIDGGFHGFIYTRETVEFALRNNSGIRVLLADQARDMALGTIEMVQGFTCFKNDSQSQDSIGEALYGSHGIDDAMESHSTVLNALAWYAGEEVCHEYCRVTGQD